MTTYANDLDRPAGVTSDGRLMVDVIARDYVYHITARNEMAYTCYVAAVTPTGAADVFFTLINTHNLPLMVEKVRFYDAHAGEIIHLQVGATYALGTTHAAVEPVNRKVGSTLLASSYCTCENGVDITGDASATIMEQQAVQNTETEIDLRKRPIVLAQNRCFNLEASAGTGAIRYEVDFCWLNPDDYIDNA